MHFTVNVFQPRFDLLDRCSCYSLLVQLVSIDMRRTELFKEPGPLIGEGCFPEMCTAHNKEP